jgi:Ca-activated chloride channel family protein
VLGLLAVSLAAAGWLSISQPAHADDRPKVLLVLDVSGSMNEKIAGGGTKFAAAKRSLKQVADALPAGTDVGLRVYGSKISEPRSKNPKACTDTQLVLPIGPLDKAKMNRAVDSFQAVGETPIAYSLGQAVGDLGTSGKRVLVLISDGEESCQGDPCPVARKLAKAGVNLQFNAIGLDVKAKARKQLKCIADAGDGDYYDASNTADLNTALQKLTQRALRPFQISGTPVKGTLDTSSAPRISAGQYKDAYDGSQTLRHYRVSRTPGSAVTASIASVVKSIPFQVSDYWAMQLTTLDGTTCAMSEFSNKSWHTNNIVSGGVSTGSFAPPRTSAKAGCYDDPELLLSMSRYTQDRARLAPVEILVSEEPPISNLSSLTDGLAGYNGKGNTVTATKPVRPVIGGTSFANAATVGLGSWSESVALGDNLLYRVRLEPGQRMRVSAQTPAAGSGWRLDLGQYVTPELGILSPARALLTQQKVNLDGRDSARITATSPQVRVRNREVTRVIGAENQAGTASIAGDYYISLRIDPLQSNLIGRVMQVQLDINVEGQPAGQPQYAQAGSSASDSPTASDSASPSESATPTASAGDSLTPLPLPPVSPTPTATPSGAGGVSGGAIGGAAAGVALLAAALVGGAVWWRRRPRPGR